MFDLKKERSNSTKAANLVVDCLWALLGAAGAFAVALYLLASWSSGDFWPFDNGAQIPWEPLARLALPVTALLGGIVGAVIAGHGQATRLDELRNSRDADVTERYTKAIEQLGSEKIAIRVGGIFALERIGHDSERDRTTVVNVLTSSLFNELPAPVEKPGTPVLTAKAEESALMVTLKRLRRKNQSNQLKKPETPVLMAKAEESALMVTLMRLRRKGESNKLGSYITGNPSFENADLRGAYLAESNMTRYPLFDANLSEADLSGAILRRAFLFGTNFTKANLQRANLTEAELLGANFSKANLSFAVLKNADLPDTTFDGAKLRSSSLQGSKFDGASFLGADLTNADLTGADLTGTHLKGAIFNGATLDGVLIDEKAAKAGIFTIKQLKVMRVTDASSPSAATAERVTAGL